MVRIKGNEIETPSINGSFERKAVQIQNNIISTLKLLGIGRDDIDITLEKNPQKKLPASISWYFNDRKFRYSYSQMPRFVENLSIIDKVLRIEVDKLLVDNITFEEFAREFSEDDDLPEQLLEARKLLGVEATETDFELINKKYKELAKKHHPDLPGGNHEKFQEINAAHKLIKKELT